MSVERAENHSKEQPKPGRNVFENSSLSRSFTSGEGSELDLADPAIENYELPKPVLDVITECREDAEAASIVLILMSTIHGGIVQMISGASQSPADNARWRTLKVFAYIGLVYNAIGAVMGIFIVMQSANPSAIARDILSRSKYQNARVPDTDSHPSSNFGSTTPMPVRAIREGGLRKKYLREVNSDSLIRHFGWKLPYAWGGAIVYICVSLSAPVFLITVALWIWCTEELSVSLTTTLVCSPLLLVVIFPCMSATIRLPHR